MPGEVTEFLQELSVQFAEMKQMLSQALIQLNNQQNTPTPIAKTAKPAVKAKKDDKEIRKSTLNKFDARKKVNAKQ